jgi:hypothetical protein
MVKALPRTAPEISAPPLQAPWIRRVLRTYGLSRLLVLGAALVATITTRDPGAGPWPQIPGPHLSLLRTLARWDGAWYLDIAQHGYHHVSVWPGGNSSFAFFPLFPWLVRALSWLTLGSPLVAALVLTTVLGAVGALLIWRLTAQIFGDEVAYRAATLFCFFPASFVLSMAYTEALTVAAAAGCLLALTRRRWVLAGGLGAAAAMTRPTAGVLVVVAVWCAWSAWRRGEGWRPLWAPALTAAGAAVVMIYQWVLSGYPFEWLRVETQSWHDRSGFTFDAVHRFVDFVTAPSLSFGLGGLNDLVWAGGFVVAVVGAVLMVRRRLPAPLLIYGFGALIFAVSSFDVGPRPRPLLVAFPIIIAIAASVRGWAWRVVLVASAVGLVALSLVSFLTLSAVP